MAISGRYQISGSEGRRHRQELVCGRVGPRGQPFAALILRRAGSKYAVWRDTPATSYSLEALALQGSSDASRQKQISWTNVRAAAEPEYLRPSSAQLGRRLLQGAGRAGVGGGVGIAGVLAAGQAPGLALFEA